MKFKIVLLAVAATGLFAAHTSAQSYAITNAKIVTVSGPTIESGTVVVRDGLIAAVGADVKAPADAQVFDGSGMTVISGLRRYADERRYPGSNHGSHAGSRRGTTGRTSSQLELSRRTASRTDRNR
jgi:hypothetical protein